jgi:nucleoside-diphosphate-sugar epimerase
MLLQNWICSSEATCRELEWQPQVRWSEGIQRAVDWYRQNGWL